MEKTTMRRIFKSYLADARLRTRDAALAQRKLIASFHGNAFAAEREGEELNIYLVSGDMVSTQTIGDRAGGMTAEMLQKQIVERRGEQAAADARFALDRPAMRR
jgi:hypothetical protein